MSFKFIQTDMFKVEKATNGEEVVELIIKQMNKNSNNGCDLVVLDLHMPICDGFEAC